MGVQVAPVRVDLAVLVRPSNEISVIPASVVRGQFSRHVLRQANEEVYRDCTSDRSTQRFEIHASVPMVLAVAFSDLYYPNAIIYPKGEARIRQEAVIYPIRRVFNEVSAPFIRPRRIDLVFVVANVCVRAISSGREYQINDWLYLCS